jgi:hypothetical protein
LFTATALDSHHSFTESGLPSIRALVPYLPARYDALLARNHMPGTPPYPLIPQPTKKTLWERRHPVWSIGAGILLIAAFIMLFVCGLLMVLQTSFKNSWAYQQAVRQAQQNIRITQQIGSWNPGWFVTGQIQVAGSSGRATLDIPMIGANGRGVLHLRALKTNGEWGFQLLQAEINGQPESIDLLAPSSIPSQ